MRIQMKLSAHIITKNHIVNELSRFIFIASIVVLGGCTNNYWGAAGREDMEHVIEVMNRVPPQPPAPSMAEREDLEFERAFSSPLSVPIGESPSFGPPGAPIVIMQFSDFECPGCKTGAQILTEVMEAYPGKIKIVFKNLPLSFHKNARSSAAASLAANKQGKFREMYFELFENQRALGEQMYLQLANKLGLSVPQFLSDMHSPEVTKLIDSDLRTAENLGLNGTPQFLVNGVLVRGPRPASYFKRIIDRQLSSS